MELTTDAIWSVTQSDSLTINLSSNRYLSFGAEWNQGCMELFTSQEKIIKCCNEFRFLLYRNQNIHCISCRWFVIPINLPHFNQCRLILHKLSKLKGVQIITANSMCVSDTHWPPFPLRPLLMTDALQSSTDFPQQRPFQRKVGLGYNPSPPLGRNTRSHFLPFGMSIPLWNVSVNGFTILTHCLWFIARVRAIQQLTHSHLIRFRGKGV